MTEQFSTAASGRTVGSMVVTLIRLLRLALILLLALFTLSIVIGIGQAQTGWAERAVLVGLIAGCVYVAARISTVTTRLQDRFARR